MRWAVGADTPELSHASLHGHPLPIDTGVEPYSENDSDEDNCARENRTRLPSRDTPWLDFHLQLNSIPCTRYLVVSPAHPRYTWSTFFLGGGSRNAHRVPLSFYQSRPSLVDRTIYAQGGAWDLLTGDEQKFDLKRSYGCGQLACSSHLAVYRSATMGYSDLLSSSGTSNYGGIRLGCWINAIPAGGLVLAPDATTGCRCSYLNQAWIALQPKE